VGGRKAARRGPKPADPSASPERLYSEIGRLKQEFQLRREVLKQLGIENVPTLVAQLAALWRYLTEDWLRLAISNPNDKTRTHWPKDRGSAVRLHVKGNYLKLDALLS